MIINVLYSVFLRKKIIKRKRMSEMTTTTFENTLECAKQLDTKDPLKEFRNKFYLPTFTKNEVVYFTGNSLGLQPKSVEKYIKEALPGAVVEIQDLAGDGNHYSATITSSKFSGKSKIEQHKMVYNSLKGKMGNELHALAIKTKE